MTNINDKYILQSVSNALGVLECLAENKNMSVPEIAERTGYGKSSVFRILATLEEKNYVRKSKDARYSLDVKLIRLGQAAMDQNDLVRYAHPYLEALTLASGETSHLAVLFQSVYCRFIDKVVSSSTIHMDSQPGFIRYAHYIACGKLLLAHSSEVMQERYMETVPFEAMTRNSILSGDELRGELDRIRKQGYAVDHEESEYGLFCVSAPVRNHAGEVIAAVSVSGPAARMEENMDKNVSLVTETAEALSKKLFDLVEPLA